MLQPMTRNIMFDYFGAYSFAIKFDFILYICNSFVVLITNSYFRISYSTFLTNVASGLDYFDIKIITSG